MTNDSLLGILDYILQLLDKEDLHNWGFLLAVSQLSISQRSRITYFAHSLYRACDSMEDISLQVGLTSDPSHTLNQGSNNAGHLIDSANVEPANTESSHNQPTHDEPSRAAQIKPVFAEQAQTYVDHRDDQPNPIEPTAIATRTSGPRGNILIIDKSEQQPESSDVRPDVATSTLCISEILTVSISPKANLNPEPTSCASTPSIGERDSSPSAPNKCDKQVNVELLKQSVDDLIHISHRQVQLFSLPGNSHETYTALFYSFSINEGENVNRWSDGSQFASFLEAGDGERHKGALHYALASIAFGRWHASQVRQLKENSPKKAAQEVSGRILGPKPMKDTASGQCWERHRKRINTHLTRGRKWSWLVKELGFGILLTDAWYLGLSNNAVLRKVIEQLQSSPEKLTVLGVLANQISLLLNSGSTSTERFCEELKANDLSVQDLSLPTGHPDLSRLCDQISKRMKNPEELILRNTGSVVSLSSLNKLRGTTWLDDHVILTCLHLSDKLPFVRVGFSVPIHQEIYPHRVQLQPLEMALKRIMRWHNEMEVQSPLVCIFPLLLHNNHFTLLEINERESCIYHYDSIGGSENADVKVACREEFPRLQYVEKVLLPNLMRSAHHT